MPPPPLPNLFSDRPQPWFASSSSSKYCMLQRLLCVTNHFSPDSIFQWIHQLCCYSNQLVIVTLNKREREKKHLRPFLYELLQSWTSLCPLCYLLRLSKGRSSVDNRELKQNSRGRRWQRRQHSKTNELLKTKTGFDISDICAVLLSNETSTAPFPRCLQNVADISRTNIRSLRARRVNVRLLRVLGRGKRVFKDSVLLIARFYSRSEYDIKPLEC